MTDPAPVPACPPGSWALRRRRSSVPGLPRSLSCQRPARQSVPDCSSCGGRGFGSRARVQDRAQPADQAGYPLPTASGPGKTRPEDSTRDSSPTAALSPAWPVPVLRESPAASARAHAESPRQSTFLHATSPKADVPYQCVCGRDARPPPPHMRAHACTHSREASRRRSIPSRESSCDPQSACEWILPKHGSGESGWSTPCPHAEGQAANARSQCTGSQTGWPHTSRRKSRDVPFLYTVRTCSPFTQACSAFHSRRKIPCENASSSVDFIALPSPRELVLRSKETL